MTGQRRLGIEQVAIAILAACAIILTSLVVRREFASSPSSDAIEPTKYKDWHRYANAGLSMGPDSAAVVIVEFSDFQCPFCRSAAAAINEARLRWPNDVRVVYRHFPLEQIHPHARRAAVAAECAEAQGRFPEFHDRLFQLQDSIPLLSLTQIVDRTGGMEIGAFNDCLTDPRRQARVDEDVEAGKQLGVRGTPTLLVNGWLFGGSPDKTVLFKLIESELGVLRSAR